MSFGSINNVAGAPDRMPVQDTHKPNTNEVAPIATENSTGESASNENNKNLEPHLGQIVDIRV